MGIIGYENEVEVNDSVKTVDEAQKQHQTAMVINRDQELDTMVQYLAGDKWRVEYFNRLVGMDDEISPLDDSYNVNDQSYQEIKGMVLNVVSPLDNNSEKLEGEAYVNSGIIPIHGDMFKTVLVGNREALFQIYETEMKSYNLNDIYSIKYRLHSFLNSDYSSFNVLKERTVKVFHYNEEYVLNKTKALMVNEEFSLLLEMRDAIPNIINKYFKEFSVDGYLKVPELKGGEVIDPGFEKFIKTILNVLEFPNKHYVKMSRESEHTSSVWDVILNKDLFELKYVDKHYQILERRMVNVHDYQNIKHYVNSYDVDMVYENNPFYKDIPDILKGTYVFSRNFYLQNGEVGDLEHLILNYMRGQTSTIEEVANVYKTNNEWDKATRYYYLPLIILLLKDVV